MDVSKVMGPGETVPEQQPMRLSKEFKAHVAAQLIGHDQVNHPTHYTSHPSGVECIQITEHMGFNLGNAIKYIWRCDLKKDAVEDLRKAKFYIEREIAKREGAAL